MGSLVFPKDRVVKGFRAGIKPNVSSTRLWSGLRLLVVGPPGVGKLSLISVWSRALDPGVKLTLFDFEAEPTVQDMTLEHFANHRLKHRNASGYSGCEALIFRHLHRLSADQLDRFLAICVEETGKTGVSDESRTPLTLHATCYDNPNWGEKLSESVEGVFPCQIHLSGVPAMKTDVGRFVLDVVAELNDRHGKRITEVESSVVDAVQRQAAWRTGLHELRSVVERAYFREDSQRLSARSIEAASA